MADPRGLGPLVRQRRRVLGLTQVELARRLGVKPAYISVIEKNRRRPSLPLLQRMSIVLGLESQSLFLLTHPEAKPLLRVGAGSLASGGDGSWRSFSGNKALLSRYRIKRRELEVLSHVRRLGEVQHPRDFLRILCEIRRALKPAR
ncbi:MAG TPA: helix-turn-helix domain-containing protein [Candidatus Binataceae bacterium]|nr:helix-turn-helix domain-containing protein [Candidatus Binataceae bacterium]